MKRIFIIAAAALSVMAASAQSIDSLQQLAKSINAKCPTAIDDGVTQTSVSLADGKITFAYLIDGEQIPFNSIVEHKDIFHDAKVAELMTSPVAEQQQLLKLCRDNEVAIAYIFTVGDQSVEILITPQELK